MKSIFVGLLFIFQFSIVLSINVIFGANFSPKLTPSSFDAPISSCRTGGTITEELKAVKDAIPPSVQEMYDNLLLTLQHNFIRPEQIFKTYDWYEDDMAVITKMLFSDEVLGNITSPADELIADTSTLLRPQKPDIQAIKGLKRYFGMELDLYIKRMLKALFNMEYLYSVEKNISAGEQKHIDQYLDQLKRSLGLASAWNDLALAYIVQGRNLDGARCLRKAISIDDLNPAFWNNLSTLFHRVGHNNKGDLIYDRYIAMHNHLKHGMKPQLSESFSLLHLKLPLFIEYTSLMSLTPVRRVSTSSIVFAKILVFVFGVIFASWQHKQWILVSGKKHRTRRVKRRK
eukprot:TRINITY_DN16686_c0_g1_i1.p1 TRINITY_DN16686_c0_g1~~TRINITY_DN16686_c0_g1_i1.p1  ORF type:complete len:371 (-),score=39.40 TRINITY_DN16686_c0_g1_i1:62-1093(-)